MDRLEKELRELREKLQFRADSKAAADSVRESARKVAAESWRKPEPALDADELLAAFDVENDSPLWLAVHQVLDDEITTAVEAATAAPGAHYNPEARPFAAGGVDALREFQRVLIARRAESRIAAAGAAPAKEEGQ